jgi:hypothetical protein
MNLELRANPLPAFSIRKAIKPRLNMNRLEQQKGDKGNGRVKTDDISSEPERVG